MDIQDKGGPINSRPKRDEYYLSIAKEVSARSTCYLANIGAIIVRDDQIIATGYVGAPRGTKDCLTQGFCLGDKLGISDGQNYERCQNVCAEQNAIINSARAGVSLLRGDMYIWGKNRASGELIDTLPCSLCKKMIINAGLRRVIIMTKNGKINIFHIEDWATEWQYNDIIDDEKQDGESIKDLIQNKVVLEARPELGTEMIVEQVDNQPENKAEIFQPTEVVGFSESNSEPEFKPALELEKDFSNNQTLNHNSMDKKIIAVVGLSGSGKGSVVKILEDKNFKKIYFGEITFDEIQKRGLQLNEQNEKVVREDLRKKYGMAAFAILNIEKIRQAYSLGNVVIESMYSWQEYLKLKDEFGENFYVLAVQVGPNIRHQRLVNREEYQNGMKRTITLKEAQERDRSQIENLAIAGPIAIADYTIVNDGSFDELYAKLDQIVNKIIN